MKLTKPTYKINDLVRVVVPEFFVRCGYPWSKDYVKKNGITKEQTQSLEETFKVFNVSPYGPNSFWDGQETLFNDVFEKVLDVFAYAILKQNKFGGRERSIHTELKEEHRNKEFRIVGKKVVRTGTYVAGSTYSGLDAGYDDYDPPYLRNVKSHVILEIVETDKIYSIDTLWIEAKNIEKITP